MKRSSPPARRTPLRSTSRLDRSAPLARSGRLRARSPRSADRYERIAEASRVALERDRYRCQAVGLVPHECRGALDPHHVISKGARADLADDPANIVGVCRAAHDWIGDHPEAARLVGLYGRSGDDLAALARLRDRRRLR